MALLAVAVLATGTVIAPWGKERPRSVRIGVNDSPPYVSRQPDGTLAGATIAVLGEAARRRRMRVEWVFLPEGPDSALKKGKVDVWHLVTDLPDRRRYIHFTDPWLRTTHFLVVREESQIRGLSDVDRHTRVGWRPEGLHGRVGRSFFPQSRFVAVKSGGELVALCRGNADAEFVEQKILMPRLLMSPPECRGIRLRAITVSGSSYQMAIGATERGSMVARQLRDEITLMARDHSLEDLCRPWLFDTADEIKVVTELAETQQRARLYRYSGAGMILIVACFGIIVHREKLGQQAIRSAYEFATNVIDTAGGMMFISDRHGRIVRFNRACEKATGNALNDVRGKASWQLFVPPEERSSVEGMFARIQAGAETSDEHHWQTRDGLRLFSWSYSVLLNKAGRVDFIIANGIDITRREAAERKLGFEAAHDPLTNLLNRRQILRELEQLVETANPDAPGFVLALSDLDKFKTINDTHGHEAGDEVLVYFASLLRAELEAGTAAGRLGGDEFCMLIPDSAAETTLERIRDGLRSHEFRSAVGRTFHADVTFGSAAWNNRMIGPADLLRAADEALYVAKRRRSGERFASASSPWNAENIDTFFAKPAARRTGYNGCNTS